MGLFSKVAGLIGGAVGSSVGGPIGGAIGSSLASSLTGGNSAARSGIRYTQEAEKKYNAFADDSINYLENNNDIARNVIGDQAIGALRVQDPYVDSGRNALAAQNALLGIGGDQAAANNAFDNFRKSTGYDFRLNEGTRALQNSAAAKGSLFSGQAGKELQDYAQGLASGEFGNYFNSLTGLANAGQQAANNKSNIITQYGRDTVQNWNNRTAGRNDIRLGQANVGFRTAENIGQIKQAAAADQAAGLGNAFSGALNAFGGGSAYGNGMYNSAATSFYNPGTFNQTSYAKGLPWSDARLKTNIVHVGQTPGGLPVYEFDYIWGGERQRGVMAQDARQMQPHAVVPSTNGFDRVDYSKVH